MTDINDFGRTSFVRHTTGLIERMEKCTMTEQQEKILAVLDMSEEEQKSWCWVNIENEQYYTSRKRDVSLADLAFRKRDEVGARFYTAMRMMYDELTNDSNPDGFGIWCMLDTKPIHWILAALMAKAKESK